MNKKRLLITTAIEKTWDFDRPVIFLGEWCKLYSRKEIWCSMDFVTLPYHWDDRNRLDTDYQHLNNLYETVLLELSKKLNVIHDVNHDLRYWRILVGPWLAYFIHILMDRWLSIRCALDNYHVDETVVLEGIDQKIVANDMNQFIELCIDDMWNHQIYAEILRRVGNVPLKYKIHKESETDENKNFNKIKIKHQIAKWFSKITRAFVRDCDVFLNKPYLSVLDEIALYFRLGQVPQFWETVQPVKASSKNEKRNWIIDLKSNNEFEGLLLSMIPKLIPTVYLEGYAALSTQVNSLRWPKTPRAIYTSNVLWHDTVSMAYTAEKVERGTPLVYGQHGGAYWTAKFTFAEEHELKISDRYLSWGWSDKSNASLIPVGLSKINKKAKRYCRKIEHLLLVTISLPGYSYRLASEDALSNSKYIESNFKFAELLNSSPKDSLLVRLTPSRMGLDFGLRWADRFPGVKLDGQPKKIYRLMRNSRIVVSTYNQTSFLETIFLNIPTVLFIDQQVTPLRDTAIPYYADLQRVGIFHNSPESAAEHVNSVWDDVDAWWLSDDVQNALAKFSTKFCARPYNISREIQSVLTELTKDFN